MQPHGRDVSLQLISASSFLLQGVLQFAYLFCSRRVSLKIMPDRRILFRTNRLGVTLDSGKVLIFTADDAPSQRSRSLQRGKHSQIN
jgi:hypothetical protein